LALGDCSMRYLVSSWIMGLSWCCERGRIVMNANGSLSSPSVLTVVPMEGCCDRRRSARAERSKSSLSTSRSCRSRVLMPWKSMSEFRP
jgi:hypothetical protein